MDNNQCALAPDGSLLDAQHIVFYHDPDDATPLPPLGRGFRVKKTSRLQESLLAEKQDDNGKAAGSRERRPTANHSHPQVLHIDESDPDDSDFTTEVGDDEEGSSFTGSDAEPIDEAEITMTNAELASTLPAKTLPLTTAGNTQRRIATAPSKRKASTTLSHPPTNPLPKKPRQTTIEDIEDSEGQSFNTQDSVDMLADAPPAPLGKSDSSASISSAMDGKKNYIYLFFEPVHTDHDGTSMAGAKYYRCWHGSRKTFKVTAAMKYSVKNMISHLQSHFPAMYQLLMSLKSRGSPPSPFEVKIAMASPDISETEINLHLRSLSCGTSSTIGEAFQKQTAASWDQAEFEKRLAEWIIACDQPFDQVDNPAFQDLLTYTHMNGSRKPLSIPGRTTIRNRIMKMGDGVIEQIKAMFKELKSKVSISLDAWTSTNQFAFLAIVAHYVSNDGNLEELLIDFKEIIGEHSGENMADAVWSTLTLYGLTDKVVAFVMDNATNNDTLLKGIETRCLNAGIAFSAKNARGRCMPHTIHLSAIALLEESHVISSDDARRASSHAINYQDVTMPLLEDEEDGASNEEDEDEKDEISASSMNVDTSAVGRLRKIVRAIRSSPQRRQAWLRAVQFTQPGDKPLIPILDVKTRWSSTYQMLRMSDSYHN